MPSACEVNRRRREYYDIRRAQCYLKNGEVRVSRVQRFREYRTADSAGMTMGERASKTTIRVMAQWSSPSYRHYSRCFIIASLGSPLPFPPPSLLPAVKREQRSNNEAGPSWLPWINASINSHRHLLNRRVPPHTLARARTHASLSGNILALDQTDTRSCAKPRAVRQYTSASPHNTVSDTVTRS